MRSIWLRRLNNLLCVKSIVTIVLTVVFARLSLAERISNQDFLTVFSILESRMRNRRNCQRRRQKNCLPKSDSGIGKRGVLDVWLWEFLSVVHPSEVSRLAGTGRTSRGPRSPWPYWSCGAQRRERRARNPRRNWTLRTARIPRGERSRRSPGRARARRPYGRDAYCGNWKGYHRRDRPGNSL